MKALLSTKVGPPEQLEFGEAPDPLAGEGEVVLAVKAAGVNFPDALIIEDKYQFKPERPFAPGGEVAGVVESVGAGVTHVKVGQRVIGSSGWGGYAEKIKLPAARVMPIPDAMPFDEASAFILTYGTSYYGLKDRGQLKAGETVLILGAAGGVGVAAIELAKAMGARVVGAVSSEDKARFARDAGADETVIYPASGMSKQQSKDLAEAFKQACGGGADVVYDAVGGDYCEPALRAMNWNGRYLVIGFPAGIPTPPLNLTLLKSSSIVGVFWGASVAREPKLHEGNVRDLFRLYGEGKIKPRISARYPLRDAGKAIRALMDRTAQGKLVVVME
ncbi:MAG TPA: NADPH:quinone oxidoreductase family protein [Vitreimonas sp.]|uniref:NADPH:quinone oxidoreductase family protein n=1 Tax=Vitreimonas sp. TaxID=3069702 RepID=UPI002D51E644|nr:NADPH:quinone oxidoreductase family protein [Vitreimonas sp.]HYD86355.1 NADPH:quinone oxidoreductase family protein [Vitreimonas sp.]